MFGTFDLFLAPSWPGLLSVNICIFARVVKGRRFVTPDLNQEYGHLCNSWMRIKSDDCEWKSSRMMGTKDGWKCWALWFDMLARERRHVIMFIIHGILCSASKFPCWEHHRKGAGKGTNNMWWRRVKEGGEQERGRELQWRERRWTQGERGWLWACDKTSIHLRRPGNDLCLLHRWLFLYS